MRDDEFVIARITVGGELFSKLSKTKCSENRDDVGVVGEIQIETLVEGECLCAAIEGGVDL